MKKQTRTTVMCILCAVLWWGCGVAYDAVKPSAAQAAQMRPSNPTQAPTCSSTPPKCDLENTVATNLKDPLDKNMTDALCTVHPLLLDAVVEGPKMGWYVSGTPEWQLLQDSQNDYNLAWGYLLAYRSYVYANKPYYWANDYAKRLPSLTDLINNDKARLNTLLNRTVTQ